MSERFTAQIVKLIKTELKLSDKVKLQSLHIDISSPGKYPVITMSLIIQENEEKVAYI